MIVVGRAKRLSYLQLSSNLRNPNLLALRPNFDAPEDWASHVVVHNLLELVPSLIEIQSRRIQNLLARFLETNTSSDCMSTEDEIDRERNRQAGPSKEYVDVIVKKLARLLQEPLLDKAQTEALLERLTNTARRDGFSDREANAVIQLALRGIHIRGKSTRSQVALKLIKSIYPAQNVQFAQDFVLSILSALGPCEDALIDGNDHYRQAPMLGQEVYDGDSDPENAEAATASKRRKATLKVQAAALKLLVLLLCPIQLSVDDLDSDDNKSLTQSQQHLPTSFLTTGARRLLDRSYGILFHYLDYQSLRPYACHLLHNLTRQKHVRQYRIAKLMMLRNMSPIDNNLDLLIAKYSQYSSQLHVSTLSLGSSRSNGAQRTPRCPDIPWHFTVTHIWSEFTTTGDDRGSAENDGQPSRKRRKGSEKSFLRKKLNNPMLSANRNLLPEATFHLVTEGKTLISEIRTFKELGYLLDRLQYPDHIVSALHHQMTQIALSSSNESEAMESNISRISRWVISAINEEMNIPASRVITMLEGPPRNSMSHQRAASIIYSLIAFVELNGYCPPYLQSWACSLLRSSIWSRLSVDEKKAVLKLIELIPPLQWSIISTQLLDPLFQLTTKAAATEAAYILSALRKLLERWVVGHDWSEMIRLLQRGKVAHFKSTPLESSVDYIDTISKTIQAAMNYSVSLLLQFTTSIDVMDAVLGLYESIFSSAFDCLHRFSLPPQYAFILLTISQYGSIHTVSRMSAVLKQILDMHITPSTFEEMPEQMRLHQDHFYSDDSRDAFNGCTEHLFGLIWKGDAFNGAIEMGAFDTGLSHELIQSIDKRCHQRGQRLGKIGSISHGAVLGPLMEAHANTLGSISQAMIKGPITAYGLNQASKGSFPAFEYRRFRHRHIDWLGENGASGLMNFFHATFDRLDDGDSTRARSTDQSTVYNYSEAS